MLTAAEMTMLTRGAARHLGGTDFCEPHDLISEAINRLMRPGKLEDALDPEAEEPVAGKAKGAKKDHGWGGRPRRWPLNMNFGKCLQTIMRSIAYGSRERSRNKPGTHLSIDSTGVGPAADDSPPPLPPTHAMFRAPSAEELAHRSQRRAMALLAAERAREALRGDPDAQRVIDGMVASLEAREACAQFGILPELYEPARKRAVRALRRRALPIFGAAGGCLDPLEAEPHA